MEPPHRFSLNRRRPSGDLRRAGLAGLESARFGERSGRISRRAYFCERVHIPCLRSRAICRPHVSQHSFFTVDDRRRSGFPGVCQEKRTHSGCLTLGLGRWGFFFSRGGSPMTGAVIHGEGLGKRYRRGLQVEGGLRHALEDFVRSPLASLRRKKEEMFWALKDVSLEVREGEVLGLIGRNGAGKTTLLKILSRITRPTTGWAEIHGRVGSLLEVGTGFHPALTGRENTFLSGAILGMGRAEIARKFDEIVAFAELEKFIDTAVKHYSSGMYVRLAFAVAAHLEPEILLVDEVLAVGDINFQKKCLGKMGDVARAGRTVALVSHQLNQIRRLCHRVVWIDGGSIRQDGPIHEVVSAYESAMARGDSYSSPQKCPATSKGRFLKWEIGEPRGNNPHMLTEIASTTIRFTIEVNE